MIMAMNKHIRLRLLSHDHRGLLCAEVRRPECAPVAIIALYIPHAGSPWAAWARDLLRLAASEVTRLRPRYGDRLVVTGDFNIRIGKMGGRRTADSGRGEGQTDPRRGLLVETCKGTGMAPLHGRPGHRRADITCEPIQDTRKKRRARRHKQLPEQGSEVDYIMMPTSFTSFRCLPQVKLARRGGNKSVNHRGIFVEIDVPSTTTLADARRLTRRKNNNGIPRPPSYHHDFNHTIAEELTNSLQLNPTERNGSPSKRYLDLRERLRIAARTAAEKTKAVKDPASAALRNPGNMVMRWYKGMRAPASLQAEITEKKRAERSYLHLRRTHGQHSPEAQGLIRTLRRLQTRIRSQFRLLTPAMDDNMLKTAEHWRKCDAATLYRILRQVVGSDDCTLAMQDGSGIPDEDGYPPATERFSRHFGPLFSNPGTTPRAVGDPDMMRFVPQAAPGDLWNRPIHWTEVYLIIFPPHVTIEPDVVCAGGGSNCPLCESYRSNLREWGGNYEDLDGNMPRHTPHLHTSVSGGPDGLLPEFIAWGRPHGQRQLLPYRKTIAIEIAQWCESIRLDGRMPAAATWNRTVLIPKHAKPGVTLNPADPASYRPITMGDVLPKVLGLVIAKRMMHWAVATGVLSPEQIGFMEGRACEDHVFSLLETVKQQWSRKQAAYILFVDLAKAYDSVHPAALWTVLEHMGVPKSLVHLLRDWSSKRRTVIRVNGTDSAPVQMLLGLGQGDVLSPLLFNLFTDSMTRYVKAIADYRGLNTFGVKVGELKYADDSAFFGDTPEQLQLVACAVQQWCEAWGLMVSTGTAKTEAMCFPAPGTPPPADLAPLMLGNSGTTISWTDSYRYLGLHLTPALNMSQMADKALAKMKSAWNQYFVTSSFVAKASPALALQVFRTVVIGGSNYLLGILPLRATELDKVDKFIRSAARQIMRMPPSTPDTLVLAETRLPTARALCLRDRTRLWLKLHRPDNPDDLAARIFSGSYEAAGLGRGTPVPRPHSYHIAPWCHFTAYLLHMTEMDGLPSLANIMLAAPGAFRASIAARLARNVALSDWRALGNRTGAPAQHGLAALQAWKAWESEHGRPPRSVAGATASLESFYEPAHAEMHAYPKTVTPLSARGPMCSGGILALVSNRILRKYWDALVCAKLGRVGLTYPPFSAERPTPAALSGENGKECPHSECGAPYCDPYHLLVECSHPHVAALRTLLAARTASIACTILATRISEPDLIVAAFCATPGAWQSRAGHFMMFRLLTATPWSHNDVARGFAGDNGGPEMAVLWLQLPASLAELFSTTLCKTHNIRPLANRWAQMAGNCWFQLATAWQASFGGSESDDSSSMSTSSSEASGALSHHTRISGGSKSSA